MSKQNNLTDFLTGVAGAIRAKKGTTAKINPQNFESEIASITTSKPEQEKTVTITENGTFEVVSDSGKVMSKVTGTVNVASEKPTLNAPTISLNGSTIIITNPSSNGNFATSYKVFNGSTLLATVTSKTVNLSTYISTVGTHSITVKAIGTNFNDSAASNAVNYIYNVYSITTNLTNVMANASNPTTVSTLASSTLTFTANTGYNLPDNVTVTGAEFTWTKSSGTLVLSNPTGNVSVTVAGVAISRAITATLTNVTAASGNATTIATGETKVLTYTANSGYTLPDSVTVTGATGVWNKDAGTLTLSNPTGNVTFTIAGVKAASGYTVTVDSSVFYNTGNLARINGVEQELDGQKIYTFNNVNTFNIYSSTAMSNITSGTGSIPETYNWGDGWAWSTDIEITQDSSCVVSNDN